MCVLGRAGSEQTESESRALRKSLSSRPEAFSFNVSNEIQQSREQRQTPISFTADFPLLLLLLLCMY